MDTSNHSLHPLKKFSANTNLDSNSLFMISKFFVKTTDYLNLIQVNSKFKSILDRYGYNPISNTNIFHNINQQHLYYRWDKLLENMSKYVICYKVSYSEYKKKHNKNMKFKYIEYTTNDIEQHGITIPYGVTHLQEQLFKKSYIETITLPNTVIHIGYNCFSCCINLKEIKLPKSLKSISYNCFNHCTSLEHIKIPKSVQTIEKNCFYYCISLRSITIPNDIMDIGTSCFYGCGSLCNLQLPQHLKYKMKSLFVSSSFLSV
ncbi:Leucine rich repeat protein bspa family [Entamoeba marina]